MDLNDLPRISCRKRVDLEPNPRAAHRSSALTSTLPSHTICHYDYDYYYYCYSRPTATEAAAATAAVNQCLLLTVPPKVRNIRFVNIGAHFISLVWDMAQDKHTGSDVTYDVIYYVEDSAPENASVVITKHPNITLDGLLPQTKYEFQASRFQHNPVLWKIS